MPRIQPTHWFCAATICLAGGLYFCWPKTLPIDSQSTEASQETATEDWFNDILTEDTSTQELSGASERQKPLPQFSQAARSPATPVAAAPVNSFPTFGAMPSRSAPSQTIPTEKPVARELPVEADVQQTSFVTTQEETPATTEDRGPSLPRAVWLTGVVELDDSEPIHRDSSKQ